MALKISLKAARVNAKKTQSEAAKKLRVSKTSIINWETGKQIPRADRLQELCDFYGIPIDNIFLPYEFSDSEPAALSGAGIERRDC